MVVIFVLASHARIFFRAQKPSSRQTPNLPLELVDRNAFAGRTEVAC
jgi:hypothetical protein